MGKQIEMEQLVRDLFVLSNANSLIEVVQWLQIVWLFFLLQPFFVVGFNLFAFAFLDFLFDDFVDFLAKVLVGLFGFRVLAEFMVLDVVFCL